MARVPKDFHHADFNPRSREGSDLIVRRRHVGTSGYFNPRSREGSDGFPFWFCNVR